MADSVRRAEMAFKTALFFGGGFTRGGGRKLSAAKAAGRRAYLIASTAGAFLFSTVNINFTLKRFILTKL